MSIHTKDENYNDNDDYEVFYKNVSRTIFIVIN